MPNTSFAEDKKVDLYAIENQLNLEDYGEQMKELNNYVKENNEDTLEDNYNFLVEHGYGVEKINFGGRESIVFHDNINTNCKEKVIICRDLEEFRQYVDVKNPTYEDVKNAITLNENIPEQYKEIIYNWLENLKQNFPNLDLVVLYYNMSTIRFEIKSKEEINKIINSNKDNNKKSKIVLAYFSPGDNKVYIQKDSNKDNLMHEIEHFITEATIQKDGIRIKNISEMPIINGKIVTDNDNYIHIPINTLGEGFEEAKAEVFRAIVSDDMEEKYYEEHIKVFKLLMSIADMDLEEFVKYGTRGLVERLTEKGFKIVDKIIEYDDFKFDCQLAGIYMLDGLTEEELQNVILAYYAQNCQTKKQPIEFAVRDLKKVANQTGFYSDIINSTYQAHEKKGIKEVELGFDIDY